MGVGSSSGRRGVFPGPLEADSLLKSDCHQSPSPSEQQVGLSQAPHTHRETCPGHGCPGSRPCARAQTVRAAAAAASATQRSPAPLVLLLSRVLLRGTVFLARKKWMFFV